MKGIRKMVAERHGITVEDLVGKRQDRQTTLARREAIRLYHERGLTPARIAELLGRDRTTILHHMQTEGIEPHVVRPKPKEKLPAPGSTEHFDLLVELIETALKINPTTISALPPLGVWQHRAASILERMKDKKGEATEVQEEPRTDH